MQSTGKYVKQFRNYVHYDKSTRCAMGRPKTILVNFRRTPKLTYSSGDICKDHLMTCMTNMSPVLLPAQGYLNASTIKFIE